VSAHSRDGTPHSGAATHGSRPLCQSSCRHGRSSTASTSSLSESEFLFPTKLRPSPIGEPRVVRFCAGCSAPQRRERAVWILEPREPRDGVNVNSQSVAIYRGGTNTPQELTFSRRRRACMFCAVGFFVPAVWSPTSVPPTEVKHAQGRALPRPLLGLHAEFDDAADHCRPALRSQPRRE